MPFNDPNYHAFKSQEEIVLDGSLQEFATKIGYICSLEHGHKIEPLEAYKRVKEMYKQLKKVKKEIFPKLEVSPVVQTTPTNP